MIQGVCDCVQLGLDLPLPLTRGFIHYFFYGFEGGLDKIEICASQWLGEGRLVRQIENFVNQYF